MRFLHARLCLLLLLGLDWYADPALLARVVQPLASHLHSTENVCPSGEYQSTIRRHIEHLQRPGPVPVIARFDSREPSGPPQACGLLAALPRTLLFYAFMSLRR